MILIYYYTTGYNSIVKWNSVCVGGGGDCYYYYKVTLIKLEMDARWDELSVGVIKLSLKMELATTNLSKIAHLEFKKKTTLIC